ncbi:hypothetical protein [Francisella sp. LA112445]|uniref:hypothetical protein n=1 Tax=Francisella sp. LA112445 TaxID=1395624 RepID=UPI001788E3C4|nr:hypothetical protein [Francisella sp. LA112445]QIW10203.1 hypothetical protein FIP56_05665 [Francisella sp. LA112445]
MNKKIFLVILLSLLISTIFAQSKVSDKSILLNKGKMIKLREKVYSNIALMSLLDFHCSEKIQLKNIKNTSIVNREYIKNQEFINWQEIWSYNSCGVSHTTTVNYFENSFSNNPTTFYTIGRNRLPLGAIMKGSIMSRALTNDMKPLILKELSKYSCNTSRVNNIDKYIASSVSTTTLHWYGLSGAPEYSHPIWNELWVVDACNREYDLLIKVDPKNRKNNFVFIKKVN